MILNVDDSSSGPEEKPAVVAIPENPSVKDSANHFRVCGRGDGMIGVYALPVKHLTKGQAINLAAWLVAMADPEGKEFERVLEEIKKT